MKYTLLWFSSTLVLPAVLLLWSPAAPAEARQDTAVAAVASPTALAGVSERAALGTLQPAAAPQEQRRAEAAAAGDDTEPGWRERLALLGAAFLALLFILRRQVTHRLGGSSGRGLASMSRRGGPLAP